MSMLDRAVLAERTMTVERHLRRVAERLPAAAADLQPSTDASDAVTLHLWQATQIVIDLAMTACLSLKLGTPASYADAFRRLEQAHIIDTPLAASMPLRRRAPPTSWRLLPASATAFRRRESGHQVIRSYFRLETSDLRLHNGR